ncbi:MAG TPA: RNA 2',3'-cyclic phosphodiesterase [Candidatus Acidoferrum sp.]|nr:RNA 2',3'-cyclic phosphodiesterase [Candidatus Acidoferrum sp.]
MAIELPDTVRTALQAPIDALQPLHDWVRSNDVGRIHLTLAFLGHLPIAAVESLQADLPPLARGHHRFRLEAQGVGAFPNVGRAQVLWAGIAGSDLPRLTRLQSEVARLVRHAGITIEDRFHPHLTLARVRRPIRGPGRKLLAEWHARWRDAAFGELAIDEIRLMRSQLGAGPPRYTTIASFSLQ